LQCAHFFVRPFRHVVTPLLVALVHEKGEKSFYSNHHIIRRRNSVKKLSLLS
jgi:hypothetical protein